MQTALKLQKQYFERLKKPKLIPVSEIRFCDRVYKYPEDFPAEVIDKFIELVTNDEITLKELNTLHLLLIELPKAASRQRQIQCKAFAEGGLSFAEYVDYQIERMKRIAENGISRVYSKRIRELLLRFRNLKKDFTCSAS